MNTIFLFLLLAVTLPAFMAFVHIPAAVRQGTSLAGSVKVIIGKDEPLENALKRFKRATRQSGTLMDLRFREHWETTAEKKKRKATQARFLNRMERVSDKYERRAMGEGEYSF
eukprot:gene28-31_t